ncbi:MAG: hypothetical protein A2507_03705 [Candidatus Magasanikbacteria bacterium RIFOXYD12_FULL_33_17]|nr:MAG: hypothetical protein A2507_03705 [Candidatus Magasanikbacteria bacterium RIFOXYD12_FULL_33_17]
MLEDYKVYGHLRVYEGGGKKVKEVSKEIDKETRNKCVFVWDIVNFCLKNMENFLVPVDLSVEDDNLEDIRISRGIVFEVVISKLERLRENFGDIGEPVFWDLLMDEIESDLSKLVENIIVVNSDVNKKRSAFTNNYHDFGVIERRSHSAFHKVKEKILVLIDEYLKSHDISTETYQSISQDLIQKE